MTQRQLFINELFKLVAILENSWDFIFSQVWLTVKTYSILYLISTWLNTSKDLLNWTYWSKPNMAKKIKFLEENWFIQRLVDENDKRIFRLYLTEKAWKSMKKVSPIYEKNISIIFNWIEQKEISNSLDLIKSILKNILSINKIN